MHDGAVEGTEPGEYLPGSKEALQASIDLATEVRDGNCVTQSALDAAVVSLDAAVAAFEDQKITGVAPEALVAHWLFNGDGADASGNGHDGTASAGHVEWGGGMPELAQDRHGNENYCYKFVDGGNFVVPNGPAFIPDNMSISVWMKLYENNENNYFFSNDIWHTWKFSTQSTDRPFFTTHVNDGSADGVHVNQDAGIGIELDKWYQVVVTYTSGTMIFYIDGEKTVEWADQTQGALILTLLSTTMGLKFFSHSSFQFTCSISLIS